jgi:SAM-dependent methyltransferase
MSGESNQAYSQAVSSGGYELSNGISGKYDNVRLYWEEELTKRALFPYLHALKGRKARNGEGLEILDIGCGSGDGFFFLMNFRDPDASLGSAENLLFTSNDISRYCGIDLNNDLLAQAEERFSGREQTEFRQADVSQGISGDQDPFDLYFTSFGTFSHLRAEETRKLLESICEKSEAGSLIIADWLGAYSYEWQDLWRKDGGDENWMDYRISYIYSQEERSRLDIPSFPLRLVAHDEVKGWDGMSCGTREPGSTGRKRLVLRELFDRSLCCGRHIATGEYNGNPQEIREGLNQLYVNCLRTDFEKIRFDYRPRKGYNEQNKFFTDFAESWNTLISFTEEACSRIESGKKTAAMPDAYMRSGLPEITKKLIMSLSSFFEQIGSLEHEDVRANIVEPRLAFVLRELEYGLQQACGCGHGFCAVFEVRE